MSDWIIGEALLVVLVVSWILTRWKSGRRRGFRFSLTIERTYEGPDVRIPGEGSQRSSDERRDPGGPEIPNLRP